MATDVTKETIRALASANGLTIPDERLELVLRQYEAFLRTLQQLETLDLRRETEPATQFSLVPAASNASVTAPTR
jgi:hypothetical protein